MNRTRRYLLPGLLVAGLSAALVFAADPSAPLRLMRHLLVEVTNTSSNPVPVQVENPQVHVVNTGANPVPVLVQNPPGDPSGLPFQQLVFLDIPAGEFSAREDIVIPAGKMLIVENVTVNSDGPAGIAGVIRLIGGSGVLWIPLTVAPATRPPGTEEQVAQERVLFYAQDEMTVQLGGHASASADLFAAATITGRLVDLP